MPANPSGAVSTVDSKEFSISRWAPWMLVIAAISFHAYRIWERRWVTDDGYINIRIIQQLFAGNGPVFNAGERVEAATSTLWLYLLALFSAPFQDHIAITAVILGLVLSVAGVVLACLGARQLAVLAGIDVTGKIAIPFGLMVIISVPRFADFSTAGLEGSLTFCWLALCFWGLGRLALGGGDALSLPWLPVVLGLGWLVRPDAALYSAFFCLAAVFLARWDLRRLLLAILLAVAIPVGYQIFRMGFYAIIVPNTALAKSAGASHWDFGLNYLLTFVNDYLLWLPMLVIGAVMVVATVRLVERRRWRAVILGGAVVLAAAVHVVYIVRVGGDFMFGRFLLPPLFAFAMPLSVLFIDIRRIRPWFAATMSLLVAWGIFPGTAVRPLEFYGHGVQDERVFYVSSAPRGTEDIAQWTGFSFYEDGRRAAAWASTGQPFFLDGDVLRRDLAPGWTYVLNHRAMGGASVAAGVDVAVVDGLKLTEPIGARIVAGSEPERPLSRLGHIDYPSEWRYARYLTSREDSQPVLDARAALACKPLARLDRALRGELTFRRFLSNVRHSPEYTSIKIPQNPAEARAKFCKGARR